MSNGDEKVVQGNFAALGHAGSDSYVGLEVIDLPEEMEQVEFYSDEFTAVCPVTGQPDLYELTIQLKDTSYSVESKSLKIYLGKFRNQGMFCEALALRVRDDVFAAIEAHEDGAIFHEDQVKVKIEQKARGGIAIEART